jgi:exonuclease III
MMQQDLWSQKKKERLGNVEPLARTLRRFFRVLGDTILHTTFRRSTKQPRLFTWVES